MCCKELSMIFAEDFFLINRTSNFFHLGAKIFRDL